MYAALQTNVASIIDRARQAWDWIDDHLTKLLAAAGLNLVVADVEGYAGPIKALAGDFGYKLVLGAAFAALIWRGVVTGRRGRELQALAQRPPDIP